MAVIPLRHDDDGAPRGAPRSGRGRIVRYAEAKAQFASGVIMSDLERLHEIIDTLPLQQVHALLTLLEPGQSISDGEFARRLAEVSEEEADGETVARILAAEAEPGEMVSHGELKRRLGL